MKVSVPMVTYNHGRFIAQAIESVLMQDLEEPFELVIGDDCSPDDTREIAESYRRAHPERIRLLPREQRLGGRPNYVRTMRACQGQYVAQLDGDDYWTDPQKLRSQIELLDANPDCAWCFHAALETYEGDGKNWTWRPRGRKPRYGLEDIAREDLASSCTVMFRRGLFGEFPDWFFESPLGDWPLHVLNARHGQIGYIDEVWAVHRHHSGGKWTGLSMIEQLQARQKTREYIRRFLDPDCAEAIQEGRFIDNYRLAREHCRMGELDTAREYLEWCRARMSQRGSFPAWKIWRNALRLAIESKLRH
jgi:glycosyltransferase involved in cell wall biosynthesis